jgi:hypothetical protein
MKDPRSTRRSSGRAITRALVPVNRAGKAVRRLGVARWRALEREQFLALVASPHQNRSKGGSTSW